MEQNIQSKIVKGLQTLLKGELGCLDDTFIDRADIEELLRDDEKIVEVNAREHIAGYPTRPLYREIGQQLSQWLLTGFCPVENLPHYALLDEHDYILKRKEMIAKITPKLEHLKNVHADRSEDELICSLREILVALGRRGLLDLLGLRKTVGTADVWPPPRRVLEETFCQRHSPQTKSPLTVGARALAKHCHRDHSSSWWGVSAGSEAAKNEHAFQKVSEILDNATWINIHQLPHEVLTIEVRQENGYGARWTSDGQQFRGFVEPQMINGHEVSWKH